jgi:2-desacetyl-2-hydroxyethyl bacteriochlorophyllide A dehydrogenase
MFTSSKALLYPKINKLEFGEAALLPLGETDVAIRTIATSVTPGIERLQLTGKSITRREIKFPMISGSELLGEIVGKGAAVERLKIGDYVFAWHCDKWESALSLFGCQAERIITGEQYVVSVNRLPQEDDILTGLLAYALSAVNKIYPDFTQRILILGLGTVGITLAECLRYKGFMNVDACETFETRARFATVRDIAFNINDFTIDYTEAYDIIIETTGRLLLLEGAINLLRKQGTFLICGSYDTMNLDYRFIQSKEPLFISSAVVTDEHLQESRLLLDSEQLDMQKIITHRFPITDYDKAFDVALSSSDALKTILTW